MLKVLWKISVLFIVFITVDSKLSFKNADNPEVVWDGDNEEYKIIKFNENNDGSKKSTIIIIESDTDIDDSKSINIRLVGSSSYYPNMNLIIEKQDSKTFLLNGNSLDYELLLKPEATFYLEFTTGEINTVPLQLQIDIVNLDDTPPSMEMKNCKMEENDINASCSITVKDPDGWLDKISGTINSTNDDEQYFSFKQTNVGDEVKETETFLNLIQPLDYEKDRIHSFTLVLTDSGDNIFNYPAIVSVGDVNDMPPEWTSWTFNHKFPEKKPYENAIINARDGDRGLNEEINYKIYGVPTNLEDIIMMENAKNGKITVKSIDRDVLGDDQIVFTVEAYEVNQPSFNITEQMTFIIEDIDDNPGLITINNYPQCDDATRKCVHLSLNETDVSIFDTLKININDIDAGENSKYMVTINDDSGGTYQSNFQIIPSNGYGDVDFALNVKNANKLDYEDKEWREFSLNIESTGFLLKTNTDSYKIDISLLDVNDETPQIQKPIPEIEIDENRDIGFKVGKEIHATDPDTTAKLIFSIDWTQSYGEKSLIRIDNTKFKPFENFLKVETSNPTNNEYTTAQFVIDMDNPQSPDYEVFDTVYIMLVVEDLNQYSGVGTDNVLVTIKIKNLNDNAPVFAKNNDKFTVIEGILLDAYIGVVTAKDDDGDLNPLTYKLSELDPKNKPWIKINPENGELSTTGEEIDCDVPKIQNISYLITVDDEEHFIDKTITIDIIDRNSKIPTLESAAVSKTEDFYGKPSILDGQSLFKLKPEDMDRDAPFNVLDCFIQGDSTITDRFVIKIKDTNDFDINVELKNDATLDRERQETYVITVQCIDNQHRENGGVQFQLKDLAEFTLTLQDVNDWTPTITTTQISPTNENVKIGTQLATIQGEDNDKDENAEVTFEILKVTCIDNKKCDDTSENLLELFGFDTGTNGNNKEAKLLVKQSLKDYFGVYSLDIQIKNKGDDPLKSTSTLTLEVLKYNYLAPKITFPEAEKLYYFDTKQAANGKVHLATGEVMQSFEATDGQNEKFNIEFSISDENDFFFLRGNNNADLYWSGKGNNEESKEYSLTIIAAIEKDENRYPDEQPYNSSITISVTFLNIDDTDPIFDEESIVKTMEENNPDLTTDIPKAHYFNNFDNSIFYLLEEKNDYFNVDIHNGTISLKQFLDYEEIKSHEFIIRASNKETGLKADPDPKSRLKVTIDVHDLNDMTPYFEKSLYNGNLLVGTNPNTPIVEVKALDVDTVGSKLTYKIIEQNHYVTNLEIKENFFVLRDTNSGIITLNFGVTENMKGYFKLNVSATDQAPPDPPHTNFTAVNIVIVTKDNTVNFRFENTINQVNDKKSVIEKILSDEFKFATHVESPISDNHGVANVDRTVAPTYFIDESNNSPINSSDILRQVVDSNVYARLKAAFLTEQLLMLNFDFDAPPSNVEEVLRTWLIGVSVVLGGLCVILLVAFILRSRSLTIRIKNLSSTKFGSQESGLNRVGLAIPNANRNAAEGANPVYNNQDIVNDYDKQSISSGDSDLIGVEDNPEFDMKY